jgi:hypothetical protein
MLQDKLYDQIFLLHQLLENPDAPEPDCLKSQAQKVRQELIENFKLNSDNEPNFIVI